MAFTDHKITPFTHKISDLADQPNLPPDELKARFDSSPEQLRQAVNAICDEADRLDTKVSGIITETFGDAIPKSMLSDELAAQIDAAAVETSVAERLADEAAARQSADTSLSNQLSSQISSVNASINTRARVAPGTYTGDTTLPRAVSMPFSPKAVIVAPQGGQYMRMVLQGETCYHGAGNVMRLSGSTLTLLNNTINVSGAKHFWLALA